MNKFHDKAIKKCLEHEEDLTEWEQEFVNSLAEQVERRELTDRQVKRLHEILHKVEFG